MATRSGDYGTAVVHQLHNPVFNNSLAVAACDTHHWDMIAIAMPSSQLLESQHHIFNKPEISLATKAELLHVLVGSIVRHHKVASAALVNVIHKTAASISLSRDGEKKRMRHIGQMTTISKEGFYLTSVVVNTGIST